MDCCTASFPVFAISWSLLKLMSVESMIASNHLILCCPLLLQSFLASGSFSLSQLFTSGGPSSRASASASVLQMNIQVWFPSGKGISSQVWLVWSPYCPRDSQESSPVPSSEASILWHSAFFNSVLITSLSYGSKTEIPTNKILIFNGLLNEWIDQSVNKLISECKWIGNVYYRLCFKVCRIRHRSHTRLRSFLFFAGFLALFIFFILQKLKTPKGNRKVERVNPTGPPNKNSGVYRDPSGRPMCHFWVSLCFLVR